MPDRLCIISDIHGNLEALRKVLELLKGFDSPIVCLGDIVGYGANPNECIRLIKDRQIKSVMGNHDAAAIGLMDLNWFNPTAKQAIKWTANKLTAESKSFLESQKKSIKIGGAFLVHGSPMNPITEYVNNISVANDCFEFIEEDITLVGHTHVPLSFAYNRDQIKVEHYIDGGKFTINGRCILNPGSVGQPRDGNKMASFAVIDFKVKEFTVYRTHYDVNLASRKILDSGLPEFLASRILNGI